MTSRLASILGHRFPDVRQRYEPKDAMLYALGLGLPRLDRPDDLRFVYEAELEVLGSFVTVLAHPGFWLADPALGLNATQVVHGEQRVRIHRTLPVSAEVVARSRIAGVSDKGAGVGAVLHYARELSLATGEPLATISQAVFCRADGGLGSGGEEPQSLAAAPLCDPDLTVEISTSPRAALIYRLSGDLNPLHADPRVADEAGYPRPILHGLASYGMASLALADGSTGGDAAALRSLDCRFRAPVFPGETLQTRIWRGDAGSANFETVIKERGVVAISNGHATFADTSSSAFEKEAADAA